MDISLENILLIPIGMVIATFASLIGIGGGLLWAPYFILFKGFDPQKAVMFSFLIQFVGMGSAAFSNIRQKTILWKMVIRLMPVILVGVVLGSFLNQRVANAGILEGILGGGSIMVSIFFASQTEKYDTDLKVNLSVKPPAWFQGQSLFLGSLTGFLSIGIGDFLIPVMRSRLKVPMRYAIGTNLFLNFSLALMGSLLHLFFSEHSFTGDMIQVLAFSWVGVAIGGQLGSKLLNVIDDSRIKEIFIFAMLIIGIHLIYKAL